MRANIVSNEFIALVNTTTHEETILWHEFSIARPGVYVDPNQRTHWDGVYRFYNRTRQRIARPLLSFLRGVCQRNNLPLDVCDLRKPWPYQAIPPDQIQKDFLKGITLDDFQVEALRVGSQVECGIFDIPTGGGKAEVACGLCQAIKCPTVILAEMTVVIDQLKERLELRDVTERVGVFYAGRRPSGESIVVGSINSLAAPSKPPAKPLRKPADSDDDYQRRLKGWQSRLKGFQTRRTNVTELLQYVRAAEMVIVDECDRSTSAIWKNLFRHQFRGRRRYGMSGTPFDRDKPVEGMIVQAQLGSVIFKESRKTLEAVGRTVPANYVMLAIGLDGNPRDATAFDIAVQEQMVDNVRFHQTIAGLCAKRQMTDFGTLILVNREALGQQLLTAIRAKGLRADFIFGKTPKRRRQEALEEFERRELDVIIGGKIINRGLDLSGGCETLVIATDGKLQSELQQKVGRALRRNKQGKSTIYGFFFRNNRYLYKHSRLALKDMVDAGYATTVVFPGGRIDGKELIKKQFRIPGQLLIAKPVTRDLFS